MRNLLAGWRLLVVVVSLVVAAFGLNAARSVLDDRQTFYFLLSMVLCAYGIATEYRLAWVHSHPNARDVPEWDFYSVRTCWVFALAAALLQFVLPPAINAIILSDRLLYVSVEFRNLFLYGCMFAMLTARMRSVSKTERRLKESGEFDLRSIKAQTQPDVVPIRNPNPSREIPGHFHRR